MFIILSAAFTSVGLVLRRSLGELAWGAHRELFILVLVHPGTLCSLLQAVKARAPVFNCSQIGLPCFPLSSCGPAIGLSQGPLLSPLAPHALMKPLHRSYNIGSLSPTTHIWGGGGFLEMFLLKCHIENLCSPPLLPSYSVSSGDFSRPVPEDPNFLLS